jgi:hypothetical protein
MDAGLQYGQQGGNLSNINISPHLLQQLQQVQQQQHQSNPGQYMTGGADSTQAYGAGSGYGAGNPQQTTTAGVAPRKYNRM